MGVALRHPPVHAERRQVVLREGRAVAGPAPAGLGAVDVFGAERYHPRREGLWAGRRVPEGPRVVRKGGGQREG